MMPLTAAAPLPISFCTPNHRHYPCPPFVSRLTPSGAQPRHSHARDCGAAVSASAWRRGELILRRDPPEIQYRARGNCRVSAGWAGELESSLALRGGGGGWRLRASAHRVPSTGGAADRRHTDKRGGAWRVQQAGRESAQPWASVHKGPGGNRAVRPATSGLGRRSYCQSGEEQREQNPSFWPRRGEEQSTRAARTGCGDGSRVLLRRLAGAPTRRSGRRERRLQVLGGCIRARRGVQCIWLAAVHRRRQTREISSLSGKAALAAPRLFLDFFCLRTDERILL
jgi:hypothetical protein